MKDDFVEPQLSAPESEDARNWKAKILLVDDNLENLIALEAVLEGPDHHLVKATSGRDALRYLLAEDVAAILLDVKMPGMDGLETASLIRARRRSRHTPIIFLTAFRNDEHLFRGYDLGAVDFLFKPILPEILQSKVAAFVQLSRNTELLRQQTQVLQRTEQKFRALLEAAPDAMVITGPDGSINLVNSRAEFLFGYRRDELNGQLITRVVPEWRSNAGDLEGLRPGGDRFPIEVTCSPLQTEEGKTTIYAIRDVTDRKKAEAEIRELNLLLEQKVRERTAELMRSNSDLAQFAYVASHDLKEPLRTIAIFAQLLEEEAGGHLSPRAREGLTHIINGVRRMYSLINDMLAYSHVDSDDAGVRTVDLNVVLMEVLFNLHGTIQDSGAVVTSDTLPAVGGDRAQLVQLLQNLIGNSLKYRSTEPPRIHVSAIAQAPEAVISVKDNGIGIDTRYGDAIFKLFKRLHVRDEYPGNGVGLAICRRIIEHHGGRIWVESKECEGATFRFTIPLR